MSPHRTHPIHPPGGSPRENKKGGSRLFSYLLLVELVLIFSMVASYLILTVINLQRGPSSHRATSPDYRYLLGNYKILHAFDTLPIRTAPIQDAEFEIGNPFVVDLFTLKTAAADLQENGEKNAARIANTLLNLEIRHRSYPHRYSFILHKKNELYLNVLYIEKRYKEFIALANRFPYLVDTLELKLFLANSYIKTGDSAKGFEIFKALFAHSKLTPFEKIFPQRLLNAYLQRLDYDFWLAKFKYLAKTNQYGEFRREKFFVRSSPLVNLLEAEFSYNRKEYDQCRKILDKIDSENLLSYKERLILKMDLRENKYDTNRLVEQLNSLQREPEVYHEVLPDAGSILMIAGEWDLAADLFSRYLTHCQKLQYVQLIRFFVLNRPTLSPLGSDYWKTLWISAWLHYKKNDKKKAAFYFRQGVDSPILSYRLANRYWLQRLDKDAVPGFNIDRYPFTYYYTLNNPLDRSLQPLYIDSLQPFIHLLNQKQDPRFPVILRDLKELVRTNLIDEAVEFIHWVREKEELSVSDKHTLVLIESLLYLRQGNDAMAFIRFRDHFDCYQCLRLPRFLSRIALPVKYMNLVERYGKMNGLDRALILSIIREESFFRPDAVSSAKANGLMQLLLPTARQVAYSHDIKVFRADLFQPALNIRLGTEYFKYLLDKYNGKLHLALAAYNAGDQRVDEWLNHFGTVEDEEFIEMIPFSATRNYVKNILRNYYYYRFYYGGPSS